MSKKDVRAIGLICILIVSPFLLLLIFKIYPRNITTGIFSIIMIIAYGFALFKLFAPLKAVNQDFNEILYSISDSSNFEDIASEMSKANILSRVFYDFKKTLRPIKAGINNAERGGNLKTKYYATVDIDNYFNENTIIIDNIAYKTINFIPQLLTGLGIFGTFLGIVQAVSELSGKDEMTSLEIQSAIQGLLAGVDVSFTTSLYGIAFSLALTMITKIAFDMIITKINRFNQQVNRSLNKSTEREGLKELERELEKQTAALERLATDITEDLGRKFDSSLQENMKIVGDNINKLTSEIQKSFEGSVIDKIAPALEKLSIVSEELGKMQQTSTTKFITDSISKIEQVISAGTQNEISKLKETMEIMTEKNNEFIMKFISGMENIEKLFESQQQLIIHTNDSAKNVNITTQNINELQQGLNSLLRDMDTVHKGNIESIDDINEIFVKLKELSGEQSKFAIDLSSMIDRTHQYSKMQEQYMVRLQESSGIIDKSINKSSDYIAEIAKSVKQYADDFISIKNTSFEIADRLNDNCTNVISQINNASNILEKNIEKVDTYIIENVVKMGTEISSISSQLNQFCNSINELTYKLDSFAQVEESTQLLWSEYHESFENLNKNINDGIILYTEQIKKGTNEVLETYDLKLAEAVTKLQGMVESISQELDSIGEVFEDMTKKIEKAS